MCRSLSRKFSSRDVNQGSPAARKVGFPTRGYRPGPDDPSFQSVQVVPPGEDRSSAPGPGHGKVLTARSVVVFSDMQSRCCYNCFSPTRPPDGPMKPAALRRLVLDAKGPLSKSLSMPDMDNRSKKRDRLLA